MQNWSLNCMPILAMKLWPKFGDDIVAKIWHRICLKYLAMSSSPSIGRRFDAKIGSEFVAKAWRQLCRHCFGDKLLPIGKKSVANLYLLKYLNINRIYIFKI